MNWESNPFYFYLWRCVYSAASPGAEPPGVLSTCWEFFVLFLYCKHYFTTNLLFFFFITVQRLIKFVQLSLSLAAPDSFQLVHIGYFQIGSLLDPGYRGCVVLFLQWPWIPIMSLSGRHSRSSTTTCSTTKLPGIHTGVAEPQPPRTSVLNPCSECWCGSSFLK